jgi:hypothetical protein
MVRTGRRSALTLGTASLLVAAAGTVVVLTRGAAPLAQAPTAVAAAHDATVITADGRSTPARAGQRVPDGAVVRTGRSGSAELVTRRRAVYLEHSGAVAVINGGSQQLRTGDAVVDALNGPPLHLDLAGDDLSVPSGSATEAQRSVSVQVGSLAGPAEITSATGQRLAIPSLAQAVIAGDALPAATTPLHLNDDAAETAAVPALVSDDVTLNDFARGINSSGGAAVHVIETGWSGATSAMPHGVTSSERVLPMVIADATSGAGGTRQARYDRVVWWRRAGGSWGVVVALLKSDASAVEATFDTLQRHQPAGQIGTVSIQALSHAAIRTGQAATKRITGSRVSITTPSAPPGGSGGGHHGGNPTPTPTPTTGPVTKVVGTVQGVVGTVLGLLPVTPPPTPLPIPSSGLAGGVLGNG